jgi:hypothetical protein
MKVPRNLVGKLWPTLFCRLLCLTRRSLSKCIESFKVHDGTLVNKILHRMTSMNLSFIMSTGK